MFLHLASEVVVSLQQGFALRRQLRPAAGGTAAPRLDHGDARRFLDKLEMLPGQPVAHAQLLGGRRQGLAGGNCIEQTDLAGTECVVPADVDPQAQARLPSSGGAIALDRRPTFAWTGLNSWHGTLPQHGWRTCHWLTGDNAHHILTQNL